MHSYFLCSSSQKDESVYAGIIFPLAYSLLSITVILFFVFENSLV